jgi:hypothetical protein
LRVVHYSSAVVLDGRSNYNPTPDGKNDPMPRFMYLYPTETPVGQRGTLLLHSDGESSYMSSDDGVMRTFSGERMFRIWYDDAQNRHIVGNDNRAECLFAGGAESALSGQPFVMSVGAWILSGMFPDIRATARQMEGQCVPYLELAGGAGAVSAVTLRFVDPAFPDYALYKNGKNDVRSVQRLEVYDGNHNMIFSQPVDYIPQEDQIIETSITLSREMRETEIFYIRLYFDFSDYNEGANASALYAWDNFLMRTETGKEDSQGGCGAAGSPFALLVAAGFVALSRRRVRPI